MNRFDLSHPMYVHTMREPESHGVPSLAELKKLYPSAVQLVSDECLEVINTVEYPSVSWSITGHTIKRMLEQNPDVKLFIEIGTFIGQGMLAIDRLIRARQVAFARARDAKSAAEDASAAVAAVESARGGIREAEDAAGLASMAAASATLAATVARREHDRVAAEVIERREAAAAAAEAHVQAAERARRMNAVETSARNRVGIVTAEMAAAAVAAEAVAPESVATAAASDAALHAEVASTNARKAEAIAAERAAEALAADRQLSDVVARAAVASEAAACAMAEAVQANANALARAAEVQVAVRRAEEAARQASAAAAAHIMAEQDAAKADEMALHDGPALERLRAPHGTPPVPILGLDSFLGTMLIEADVAARKTSFIRYFDQRVLSTLLTLQGLGDRTFVVSSSAREFFRKFYYRGLRASHIYLDASHEYLDTLEELHLAYECLEEGGVLAGDDYNWATVKAAVDRFCFEKRLSYFITPGRTFEGISALQWTINAKNTRERFDDHLHTISIER